MSFSYRCPRDSCRRPRKTLKRPNNDLRCPECGAVMSLRLMERTTKRKRETCNCDRYPYPHSCWSVFCKENPTTGGVIDEEEFRSGMA